MAGQHLLGRVLQQLGTLGQRRCVLRCERERDLGQGWARVRVLVDVGFDRSLDRKSVV